MSEIKPKRKRKKKEETKDPFEFAPARKRKKRVKNSSKGKLSQQDEELLKAKKELAEKRRRNRNGSKTAALENPFQSQSQPLRKRKRIRKVKETPIRFPLVPDTNVEPSPMKSIEERERLSPIQSSQGAFFSDDEDLEDFKILTGPSLAQPENDQDENFESSSGSQGRPVPLNAFDGGNIEDVALEISPITPQPERNILEPPDPLEDDPFEASSILLRSPDLSQPAPFSDMRSPKDKILKSTPEKKENNKMETPSRKKSAIVLNLQDPEDEKPKNKKSALDLSNIDTSGLSQKGYSSQRKTKKRKKKRSRKKKIPFDPVFEQKAKEEMEAAKAFYRSVDSMELSDCFIVEVQK